MTKAELETKHISELHSLAAAGGVERYRMLTRAELIERLADGEGGREPRAGARAGGEEGERRERPRRRRRSGSGSGSSGSGSGERQGSDAAGGPREKREPRRRQEPSRSEGSRRREPSPAEAPRQQGSGEEEAAPERAAAAQGAVGTPPGAEGSSAAAESRPRRRRRRRFGRRGKQGVTLQGLLLPPEAGRQTLLLAESRAACTALLRAVAADLAADAKGPDPVALLIDPSPEELADWKRDAPQAEIVSAGQPRHADDALAQARSRAASGEDVILLVDSLTRLGEAYGDAEAAKDFFDAGRTQGTSNGSLTVVAALERGLSS